MERLLSGGSREWCQGGRPGPGARRLRECLCRRSVYDGGRKAFATYGPMDGKVSSKPPAFRYREVGRSRAFRGNRDAQGSHHRLGCRGDPERHDGHRRPLLLPRSLGWDLPDHPGHDRLRLYPGAWQSQISGNEGCPAEFYGEFERLFRNREGDPRCLRAWRRDHQSDLYRNPDHDHEKRWQLKLCRPCRGRVCGDTHVPSRLHLSA